MEGSTGNPASEAEGDCPNLEGNADAKIKEELHKIQSKAAALEDLNNKKCQELKDQEITWKNEKTGLLQLVCDLENKLIANEDSMKRLQERFAMAECAVERLSKSKAELVEDISRKDHEIQQMYEKLSEAEFAVQLMNKSKENESSIIRSLQEKVKSLENAEAKLREKEQMLDTLSGSLANLEEAEQKCSALQAECLQKTKELQLLSASQESLKHELRDVKESHEKKLQELYEKLTEAENVVQLLQTSKENDAGRLSETLEAKTKALEYALSSVDEKQKIIDELSTKLANTQDLEQKRAILEEECLQKTKDLQSLLKSQESMKHELHAIKEKHEKDMHQMHEKLVEAESVIQSLESSNRNDGALLLDALQAKSRAFEDAQARLIEKEKAVDVLSTELDNLQNLQHRYAMLQQECQQKTNELQLLSKSKESLKQEFQACKENHEKEMHQMQVKLIEAEDCIKSLERLKEADACLLSEALQSKTWSLEAAMAALNEKEKAIDTLSSEVSSLHDIQQKYTLLQEECRHKTKELQTLSNSKGALKQEITSMKEHYEKEINVMRERLVEAEQAVQVLERSRKADLEAMEDVLQVKTRAFEDAQAALLEKEKAVDALSSELAYSQDLQKKCTMLEQENLQQTNELQLMFKSHEKLKQELAVVMEDREKRNHDMTEELKKAEFEIQSLQKAKDAEKHMMSDALNAKAAELEHVLTSLRDKEKLLDDLSCQLEKLEDVHHRFVCLEKEHLAKLEEIQLLSISKENLKNEKCVLVEEHKKEVDDLSCKLQNALSLQASKESELEDLKVEAQSLRVALENLKNCKAECDLEICKLKKDLYQSQEDQYEYKVAAEKALNEIESLRDALKENQIVIEDLKAQQFCKDKEFGLQMDAYRKQLDEYRQMEEELKMSLKEQEIKVVALQEQHRKDHDGFTAQRVVWEEEKEKMVHDLDSMHVLMKSKDAYLDGLEEKLTMAKDAVNSTMQTKEMLVNEISQLKVELEQVQTRLQEAHSTIDTLEKSKHDGEASLSELLSSRTRDMENLKHELLQNQDMMARMTVALKSLEEIQLQHASCENSLRIKEEELNAMVVAVENSKKTLSDLQNEYRKKTNDLVGELEQALECKSVAEKRVEELVIEFERANVALEKSQVFNSELRLENEKLTSTLEKLQSEHLTIQQYRISHEESKMREIQVLKESLDNKERELNELKQSISTMEISLSLAKQQEEELHLAKRKIESLDLELKQKALQFSEVYDMHQKTLRELADKEGIWSKEKENLLSQLEHGEVKNTTIECKLQSIQTDFNHVKSRCDELDQRLARSDAQVEQLKLKLDESAVELEEKRNEVNELHDKLQMTSSSLKTVLEEKESSMAKVNDRINELEKMLSVKEEQNHECRVQVESFKDEVQMYLGKVEVMEKSNLHLNECISEKLQEIASLLESKEFLEAELVNTTDKLRLAKADIEIQTQELRESIHVSEQKLQKALEALQRKDDEFQELLRCLDSKESALNDLAAEKATLMQENEVQKQSIDALHDKIHVLSQEIENEKLRSERLCSLVDEKEKDIVLHLDEVKSLQQSLSASMIVQEQMIKYEEKMTELEENLKEAVTSLQETEEKLIASEWAVQQLANEVSKAKRSLAQKEREETILQNRLSDADNRLGSKERELSELDNYVQNLVKKISIKKTEVDHLKSAIESTEIREDEWKAEKQRLLSEISRIENMLDSKSAELESSQEQLRQTLEQANSLEVVIESLKSQISEYVQTLSEEQMKYGQVVQELEVSRNNERLVTQTLEEMERRMTEANIKFSEQIERLQKSLSETHEELEVSLARQHVLEADLNQALTQFASQHEKSDKLSEFIATKERVLQDLQYKFDLLQEQDSELKKLVDKKNAEIIQRGTELQQYIDKEKMLAEKVSFLNSQLKDVSCHLENEQNEKGSLQLQLHTIQRAMSLKCEEIEYFKECQHKVQLALDEKQRSFEEAKSEWSFSLDKLNSEIGVYSRKQLDVESQSNTLVEIVRDMLCLLRGQGDGFTCLKTLLFGDQAEMEDGTLNVDSETKEESNILLSLKSLLEELQLEQQKRLSFESVVAEKIRNILPNLASKGNEIQLLTSEIQSLKKVEEDWIIWFEEMLAAQSELEKEMKQIMNFIYPKCSMDMQFMGRLSDVEHVRLQMRSCAEEIRVVSDRWRSFVDAHEQFILAEIRLLNENLDKNVAENHVPLSSSALISHELEKQLTQLKFKQQTLIQQKVCQVSDAKVVIERLQKTMQDIAEKEIEARELVSTLNEELAGAKLKVELAGEKEQHLTMDLQSWRQKAESLSEEVNILTTEVRNMSDLTKQLNIKVDDKEAELKSVRTTLDTMKMDLARVVEAKQNLDIGLKCASKHTEELKKEIADLKEEGASVQKEADEWKQKAYSVGNEKIFLESQLLVASQERQQILEQVESEKRALQQELDAWKQQAEQNKEDNAALRLQVEKLLVDVQDAKGKLQTAEQEKEQLQSLCQKLEADLLNTREANGEREVIIESAFSKIKESSNRNRKEVESKLKVIYDAMTNGADSQIKPEIIKIADKHLLTSDSHCQPELEIDHYLELCDSLIRRHARLEKQLEKLTTNASGCIQQTGQISGSSVIPQVDEVMVEEVTVAVKAVCEKRKKSSDSLPSRDGRKPLKPMSQVDIATTPSPCAKRMRSSISGSVRNFENQNFSPRRITFPFSNQN